MKMLFFNLFILLLSASVFASNKMTFYGCPEECETQENPSCGGTIDTDYFCALSTKLGNYCDNYVVVMETRADAKKLVRAKIVDSCSECPTYRVDLSKKAFTTLTEAKVGKSDIIWAIFTKTGSIVRGPFYNSVSEVASSYGISDSSFIAAFKVIASKIAANGSTSGTFSITRGEDTVIRKTTVERKTTTRAPAPAPTTTQRRVVTTVVRKTQAPAPTTTQRRVVTTVVRKTQAPAPTTERKVVTTVVRKTQAPAPTTERKVVTTVVSKTPSQTTAPTTSSSSSSSQSSSSNRDIPSSSSSSSSSSDDTKKVPLSEVYSNTPSTEDDTPVNDETPVIDDTPANDETPANDDNEEIELDGASPDTITYSTEAGSGIGKPTSNTDTYDNPIVLNSSTSTVPVEDINRGVAVSEKDDTDSNNGNTVGVITAVVGTCVGASGVGLFLMKKKNPSKYDELKKRFPDAFNQVKRRATTVRGNIRRSVTKINNKENRNKSSMPLPLPSTQYAPVDTIGDEEIPRITVYDNQTPVKEN